eukprot:773087-Rhodomonas_salina.1
MSVHRRAAQRPVSCGTCSACALPGADIPHTAARHELVFVFDKDAAGLLGASTCAHTAATSACFLFTPPSSLLQTTALPRV